MLKYLFNSSVEKNYFLNTQDAFLEVSKADTTAKKVIEVVKLIVLMPWLLIIDSISILNKKDVKRISFKEKLFIFSDKFFEKHRSTLIKAALVGVVLFAGNSSRDRILEILEEVKLPTQPSPSYAKRIFELFSACLIVGALGALRWKRNNPISYINLKLKFFAFSLGNLDVGSFPKYFNVAENDIKGLAENIEQLKAKEDRLKSLAEALKTPFISWVNSKLKELTDKLEKLDPNSFLEGLNISEREKGVLKVDISTLEAEIVNLKTIYLEDTNLDVLSLNTMEGSIRGGTEALNKIIELIKKTDKSRLEKLKYQIEFFDLFIKKLEKLKLESIAKENITTGDGVSSHVRTMSYDNCDDHMMPELF